MQSSALFTVGLPIALFIIMIGMGLSLTPKDFHRVVEQPRGVISGTLGQLLGIPLLGFLIAYIAVLFGSSGVLAAGLVLVAICPGGTTSNLICYLAKADLALSITLTVISSFVTILTIPPLLNLALSTFTGEGEVVRLPFMRTLIMMSVVVIIPTAIGMLLRAWKPVLAQRLEPLISKFSGAVLLAIVIAIVVTQRGQIPGWIGAALLPAVALNIASLAFAWSGSRLLGLAPDDQLTLIIELSLKNTTIGLLVALSMLENVELAIPSAIYGMMMYASAAYLVHVGRARARRKA